MEFIRYKIFMLFQDKYENFLTNVPCMDFYVDDPRTTRLVDDPRLR